MSLHIETSAFKHVPRVYNLASIFPREWAQTPVNPQNEEENFEVEPAQSLVKYGGRDFRWLKTPSSPSPDFFSENSFAFEAPSNSSSRSLNLIQKHKKNNSRSKIERAFEKVLS